MTPLPLEYAAVSAHISERQGFAQEGATYERGLFKGAHADYEVVICEPGMKNANMALATERAIQLLQPSLVFLCGIAGGIKDVELGDVCIAKSAFSYDSGKESEDDFLLRTAEYHFSEELLSQARLVARSSNWRRWLHNVTSEARVHLVSVAAGDKVVAAINNATYHRITRLLSHCAILEMEATGFGLAMKNHHHLHAIVIRGVSDKCIDKAKTDTQNWQPIAAANAAAVLMELLWQLNPFSFIKISNMDVKTMAKQIYDLLFPAALKEISSDFADAANEDIRSIWKKVKPYFINEVEKLAKDPDNEDRQGTVRTKIMDAIEDNPNLKNDIEDVLRRNARRDGLKYTTQVYNSKNVVIGGRIEGKNIQIGDKTKK